MTNADRPATLCSRVKGLFTHKDKSARQWNLSIRAVKDSNKWRYSLFEVTTNGAFVSNCNDLKNADRRYLRIHRIELKDWEEFDHVDDADWTTLCIHSVHDDLLTFLHCQTASHPELKIGPGGSTELQNVITTFLLSMGSRRLFSSIYLPFYGLESEQFLVPQLKSGKVAKLELQGEWPQSVKFHIMTYLLATKEPILHVSYETGLIVDRMLFDLIYAKFQSGKTAEFKLSGYLGIDTEYFCSLAVDWQCYDPLSDVTWRSSSNSVGILCVEFEDERVVIYTSEDKLTDVMCTCDNQSVIMNKW